MPSDNRDVTALLDRIRQGSSPARANYRLALRSSSDVHRLRLKHERPGRTFASADLANEALIRLIAEATNSPRRPIATSCSAPSPRHARN